MHRLNRLAKAFRVKGIKTDVDHSLILKLLVTHHITTGSTGDSLGPFYSNRVSLSTPSAAAIEQMSIVADSHPLSIHVAVRMMLLSATGKMKFCLFIYCPNTKKGWIILDDDVRNQPIEFQLYFTWLG